MSDGPDAGARQLSMPSPAHSVTTGLSPERELLGLWEHAASRTPIERDDAMLSLAQGSVPDALGARNAGLLQLRARLFGVLQTLHCTCPACGETVEFDVDCAQLAAALDPPAVTSEVGSLVHQGWRVDFRAPQAADLRAAFAAVGVAGPADDVEVAFATELLHRCVVRCVDDEGRDAPVGGLPGAVMEELSIRLDTIAPGASVDFEVACHACATRWSSHFDVGQALWSEVQARAERILFDIDVLARAYGWTEGEVLALSPMRRAAYLQLAMVTA